MRTEMVFSETDKLKIEKCQEILAKMEMYYADLAKIVGEKKARESYYNNPTVKLIEKDLANIFSMQTGIFLIAETPEDKVFLKELIGDERI
ncbi:hypothetical protein B5F53_12035 [Blautia sp. An249]|uniref:hypothetical protein n=1 Tax=Blautia sp. An249 TaxID=1965603 RepID=UPI000B37418C|nr:hypothetical protein [Blautia sp. An249]OUO77934.1 hypothetical protein B5F53_12035 [Blautia sp. An249]